MFPHFRSSLKLRRSKSKTSPSSQAVPSTPFPSLRSSRIPVPSSHGSYLDDLFRSPSKRKKQVDLHEEEDDARSVRSLPIVLGDDGIQDELSRTKAPSAWSSITRLRQPQPPELDGSSTSLVWKPFGETEGSIRTVRTADALTINSVYEYTNACVGGPDTPPVVLRRRKRSPLPSPDTPPPTAVSPPHAPIQRAKSSLSIKDVAESMLPEPFDPVVHPGYERNPQHHEELDDILGELGNAVWQSLVLVVKGIQCEGITVFVVYAWFRVLEEVFARLAGWVRCQCGRSGDGGGDVDDG